MTEAKADGDAKKMTRESAWLIETGSLMYWDGTSLDRYGFTEKVDDAIRFARRQDAEVIKYRLIGIDPYGFALRSAEHIWIDNIHDKRDPALVRP